MCSICDGHDWLLTDRDIEVAVEDGKLEISVCEDDGLFRENWKKKINYCPNCGKDLREGKDEQ
jgi:hypothetical protein